MSKGKIKVIKNGRLMALKLRIYWLNNLINFINFMSTLPKKFYYKKNRLQQLKGFYYTVQTGSISKAAIEMGLNQSTVTLQIQALERDLQTKLLERHSKPIKLTKDGKALYEMSSYYLQGIDNLYEEFVANKSNDKQINIATDCDIANYLLPEIIGKFSIKNPEIKIVIKNIDPELAIKELERRRLDMIIYPNINLPNQLLVKNYLTFSPVLIMNKRHPLAKRKKISIEEVNKYAISKSDNCLQGNQLKRLNIRNNICFEGFGSRAIEMLVKQNITLGLVSNICLKKEKQYVVYKNFSKYFQDINYKIAYGASENATKEIVDLIINAKP